MIKQVLLLSVVFTMCCCGVAKAVPAHRKPPAEPYDPTRKVRVARPFEVGDPGKKKFTPVAPENSRTKIHVHEHISNGTNTTKKYGSTPGKYASDKRKVGGRGGYEPIERETVVKYNNMVVEANKRLKTAGRLYGKTIKPLFFDEEAKIDDVKEAQDYLAARVEKILKVMKAYNVPKTKGAGAMNKAHLAFLNYQAEMTKGPLNKIMELLEDPNLKPEDKKEEIKKIVEDMRKGEVKHYLALKRAQDAYGEAHGIEIIREKLVQPGQTKKGPPGQIKKKTYRAQR